MKKMIFLIPIIMLMILSSCEGIFDSDDGPKLPPITTTREDTFGCKIDEKVFVNYSTDGLWEVKTLYKKQNDTYIEISARSSNWNNEKNKCPASWVELIFWLDSSKSIKSKAKIQFLYCSKASKTDNQYTTYKTYEAYIYNDIEENHFEIVNYDTTDSDYIFFSCKFNGIVEAEDGDTKKITDGRFDVKILK